MRQPKLLFGMLVVLACWFLPQGVSRGDEPDVAALAVEAVLEAGDLDFANLDIAVSLAEALAIGGRTQLRDSLVASMFQNAAHRLENWKERPEIFLFRGAAFARMGEGSRAEAIYAMAPDHVYSCQGVTFQAEHIAQWGHLELATDLLRREIDFNAVLSNAPNEAYLPCYLPAAGLLARDGDTALALSLTEASRRVLEARSSMTLSFADVTTCVQLIDAAMVLSRLDLAEACLSMVGVQPFYAAVVFNLAEDAQAFPALIPLADAIPLSPASALPRLHALVAAVEADPDAPNRQAIEAAIPQGLPVVVKVLDQAARVDYSDGAGDDYDWHAANRKYAFVERLAPVLRCAALHLPIAGRCRQIAEELLDRAFAMSATYRPGCGHGLWQRLDMADAYRVIAKAQPSEAWDGRIRALIADAAICPAETFEGADATDDAWRSPLTAARLAFWLEAPSDSKRLLDLAAARAAGLENELGLAPLGRVALVMQRLGHEEDAIGLIGSLSAHDRAFALCLMTWLAEAGVVRDDVPTLFD